MVTIRPRALFQTLDADANGRLSPREVVAAASKPDHRGEVALAIVAMWRSADEVAALDGEPGISESDVARLATTYRDGDADRPLDAERSALYRSHWSDRFALGSASSRLYASADPMQSIVPSAVTQPPSVGNCYFVAALAALAAVDPRAIEEMIEIAPGERFTVTFPGDAEHPVTIDAPTDAEIAMYGGASEGLWSLVLQKAYGEYCNASVLRRGPFQLMPGATPLEGAGGGSLRSAGIAILTRGAVNQELALTSSATEIDGALRAAFAEGRPVTAGINGELFALVGLADGRTDGLGLPTSHEYSVTRFEPNEEKPEQGVVTLRNPWGGPFASIRMSVAELRNEISILAYAERGAR